MQEAGIKAFEARCEARSEIYSFEKKAQIKFDRAFEEKLKANKQVWTFFEAQIPSYRRTVTHWVMSAKQEETRKRRLEQLIGDSQKGLWIPPLRRAQRKKLG